MKAVVLFFCFSLAALAKEATPAAEKKTDFLRVQQTETAAFLQTAITTYEKEGQKVALIGAVHIADQSYYDALNQKFTSYDKLLYEMIGGEKMAEIQKNPPKPSVLSRAYSTIAGFLKLAEQAKDIDYSPANFVHADLTHAEFQKLQKERGESILSFAMDASKQADPKTQPKFMNLMAALLSGDANKVKLQLIDTLGAGDDQIGAFTGKSVIITDRNAKCLNVLDVQLKEGHQQIGIFYGAAHFPDLEQGLKKRGFKIAGKQEWLNAWTIQKKK